MVKRRFTLIAVLVLALAAAVSTTATHAGKPTPPPPTPPPNAAIVYNGSGSVGKKAGVWKVDADGSNQAYLRYGAGCPSWSPDATRMVVNWFQAPEPYGNLYRIDADGSNPFLLDELGGCGVWSPAPEGAPTHDLIAYKLDDSSIMLIDAGGGTPVRLLQGTKGGSPYCNYGLPDWSPDGEMLAVIGYCDPGVWPEGWCRSNKEPVPSATNGRYIL